MGYISIQLASPRSKRGFLRRFLMVLSFLAKLHHFNKSHPNRVSSYRQYFDELNIQGFDFSNGFKCDDVYKSEKLINFPINTFELSYYQDQNIWKRRIIPIEISKNESDKGIALLIYIKNHYVLIKKLNTFLGNHNCEFVCRRCLSSYTSQNVINKHIQRSEQHKITSVRTSVESHLLMKKHFPKSPLNFRIYAADNDIDNSNIGKKQ